MISKEVAIQRPLRVSKKPSIVKTQVLMIDGFCDLDVKIPVLMTNQYRDSHEKREIRK